MSYEEIVITFFIAILVIYFIIIGTAIFVLFKKN